MARITDKQRATLTTCGWTVTRHGWSAYRTDKLAYGGAVRRRVNAEGAWELHHLPGHSIAAGTEQDVIQAALAAGDAYARFTIAEAERDAA